MVPHLRGNVFIQYEKIESAISAFVTMQGRLIILILISNLNYRFYAGYPLRVQFSLIKDWKQAICAYNGNQGMSKPKLHN